MQGLQSIFGIIIIVLALGALGLIIFALSSKKGEKSASIRVSIAHVKGFSLFYGIGALLVSKTLNCLLMTEFAPKTGLFIDSVVFWAFVCGGFVVMGGQVIAYVMARKGGQGKMLKLYYILALLSFTASIGAFAANYAKVTAQSTAAAKREVKNDSKILTLEKKKETLMRRIESAETSLQSNKDSLQEDKDNGYGTRGTRTYGPLIKSGQESIDSAYKELAMVDDSIMARLDSTEASSAAAASTMFESMAKLVILLSCGLISESSLESLSLLIMFGMFTLFALGLDLVAAMGIGSATSLSEEDYQSVLKEVVVERQRKYEMAAALVEVDSMKNAQSKMQDLLAKARTDKVKENSPTTNDVSTPSVPHVNDLQTNIGGSSSSAQSSRLAASTTPEPPQAVAPPQAPPPQPFVPPQPAPQRMTAPPPPSHSYSSSNSMPTPEPEKIAPSRSIAPMTAKRNDDLETMTLPEVPRTRKVEEVKVPKVDTPKPKKTAKPVLNRKRKATKKSKKRWVLDHKTLEMYVSRAYRIPGVDKANRYKAWLGRRGEKGISGHTGIPESMCERIQKILTKSKLVGVKVVGRQQWTIPKFEKKEMLKKIKEINL